MEMHAHMPKTGRTVGHWLLEGFFIVVSVALGFWVTQLREDRENRQLVTRVLKGVDTEVRYNVAALEPFLDVEQRWIKAIETAGTATDRPSAFPVCPTSATACGLFFATRPDLGNAKGSFPILRHAAWDTALSTGALRLVDYELASGLSEIYQMQDLLRGVQEKIGESDTDWYDPAVRPAAGRKLYMLMVELEYDHRQLLLPLYRKYLPLISQGANGRR
jgi:hypothetical protein